MEPTTRLCLKNIPLTLTETALREKLLRETKGVNGKPITDMALTDVRIARTKHGKSRQLAFIGFKTAEQCAIVQRYWNRAFMGTIRVQVRHVATRQHHAANL